MFHFDCRSGLWGHVLPFAKGLGEREALTRAGRRFAARSGRAVPFIRGASSHHLILWRDEGVASYGLFSANAQETIMSSTLEILEAEALKLPPADRSHLLERLIASLDSDPEVEDAWEREADRREAALESGSVAEVSGPEAIARLRAKLAR